MPKKGMFDTPPPTRTTIKTRGALEREKLKHAAKENSEVHSHEACTAPGSTKEELMDHAKPHPIKATSLIHQPAEEGSLKAQSGVRTPISSTKSSLLARKKQLELDAAEAKARIEKELIDKKLAAELAALEDEQSRRSRSRCSGDRSSISGASRKVEKWLQNSHQDDQQESVHAEPKQEPNCATPTGDFYHLAQAMEKLATSTQNSNTQLLSRLATSKDLPIFSGESLEWIQFKKSYDQSTKLCNYSDSENIVRLNKSLRGEARETVSSLLTSDTPPSTILEALELRFGRPDLIVSKILIQLKKFSPLPQAYHTELVNFAVKVKNYVAAAQSINQIDHLRSPELLNIVISKCPSSLINKWADYIYENCDPGKTKLQLFSEFLHKEATKIAAAGVTHIHSQGDSNSQKFSKKFEERKIPVYSVLNNDSDYNAKCKFCRTTNHPLSICIKFKRALRKDKWRFVKINKYCHKCLLPGHAKETCPAAPCDVDSCGLPHHRLLHWPTKLNPAAAPFISSQNEDSSSTPIQATTSHSQGHNPTSETVTNTIAGPSASVMLKIVRVNVHGPSGIITTHALLDDGATVSLISADLANSVNLQGHPQTLSIKGAWNSNIVCKSEVVNFQLCNINNEMFDIRARKISELDLPTQNYSKVNLNAYEHLRNLKGVLNCGTVKPKLLIGQDNFHLIMSLQTVYRCKNEPCATLTPLGWCLHGIVPASSYMWRGQPSIAEHALSTTYGRAQPAATVYVTSVAPSLATPADVCSVQQETHTSEDAHMYPAQQWPDDSLSDSEDKQLHELVRRSFALESIGVNSKPRVNKDDIRAVSIINNSARLINGNYEISLPWKNDLKMPDSYPTAYKRFRSVERKLTSNEDYAKRYKERIDHLLQNNYARLLSEDELSASHHRIWYLPHFGVDNENKKKLRLVFDAAATTAGHSLNEYLLQGPDLLQSLLGIMLRFREKPIAIMGDIKDYFLRIKIKDEDQHALRFLWREDVNSELKTYVMTSLIFGANCSPFIAQHIKNLNAMRFKDEMPEATEAILKSHYMDDYIESVDNEHLAVKMIREVSEIHKQGGFLNTYKLSNTCDWLRGPDFLNTPREQWPQYDPETQKLNNQSLVNTIHTLSNEDLPTVPDPSKFSSWIRLWRCMANVLLFIRRCRKPRNAQINSELMQRAETELLRYSQLKSFSEEIYSLKNNMPLDSSSRLRKLTPFLDEYGLLRVGGRIDAASGVDLSLKRPIILDGHDQITKLILHRYHVMVSHGSNETVVNDVRQKYWVIKLRPAVRNVAARCLYCRIRKVNSTNPRMGDLPAARLAHHQRPFTHCGVDLFGFMEVTVGRRHEKRYGVLFTCMTIRAIHIELVPSLSADSFIMALRRMAARRGWPHRMHSDNGTNLRGAEAELRRSFKEISDQASIKELLSIHKLEWHFLSPVSPNMGGAWERLIQNVKAALKPILKETPREEVLSTLLAEVENIVNSRPLSYVSVNHGDPESLTPNHFLIGSSSNLPVPGQFCDTDLYRKKMWRTAQRLTDFFWQRWMREVLPTMLPRQKWHKEGCQLKKGDVVVIVDPAMPRNVWPKGLVHDVHPGADGRIRIVDVKTKMGILTRPVSRLALLPTANDDCP